MEFTTGGRLTVRITPADVGKRVSVRRLTGSFDGTEKFTDTVGVLTSWDDNVVLITRRTGETVRIAESSLVAGKVVPAAPARRRGPAASFRELARVAARAWQPVEREALGDWELRASGGFTRRANSVLPLGEPGMPLDDALARVRRWYDLRSLPAYIQTATGAEGTQELLCTELEARGWRREVTAELRVGALAPLVDGGPDPDAAPVRLDRSFDEGGCAATSASTSRARMCCGCSAAGRPSGSPRSRVTTGCRPRSAGVSWTGAGRASWPSRSIPRGGGRGWRAP